MKKEDCSKDDGKDLQREKPWQSVWKGAGNAHEFYPITKR